VHYDFDSYVERRGSGAYKWDDYDEGVLPLWVADMDFVSPEPVLRALRDRVEHGVFGYGRAPGALYEIVQERLKTLYGWDVSREDILFLPGVITGFNLACHAVGEPGDGVLVQPPVYHHFLSAPGLAGRALECAEVRLREARYEVDFDAFEAAIGDRTRLFILCNPHNPVGRVYERDELERLAEICLRHDVVICSDEIHCDLVFSGHRHLPIAALAPEVAARTITLMAPSKTFNVAGLKCSFAVVQDEALRARFVGAYAGLVASVNLLGYAAALAAYTEGQAWLDQVLAYLEANRDFLLQYVAEHLPGVHMVVPEGTYLAWLDCREAGIEGQPGAFFLREARVALNEGAVFGAGGEGFVRLNFACPRSTLSEALERMRGALERLG
jgi:cystathionine beta-lyase